MTNDRFETLVRVLGSLLPILVLVYSTICSSAVTNWFRYPQTLESSVVVVAAILALLLVVAVALVYRSRWNSVGRSRAMIAASTLSLGAVAVAMYESTGSVVPTISTAHIERNAPQTLEANGESVRYHLEIENPFADSPECTLVLVKGGVERRVELPRRETYTALILSNTPSDWAQLAPGLEPDTYLLHTTSRVGESDYLIDLGEGTARRVDPRPGA